MVAYELAIAICAKWQPMAENARELFDAQKNWIAKMRTERPAVLFFVTGDLVWALAGTEFRYQCWGIDALFANDTNLDSWEEATAIVTARAVREAIEGGMFLIEELKP